MSNVVLITGAAGWLGSLVRVNWVFALMNAQKQ